MKNINNEYIKKVRNDINNHKDLNYILNKYKNKYNTKQIDGIIAHIKVRKDIDNGKDSNYILNKYKNKYNSDSIDGIIAHKIIDDIYMKPGNMNHHHSVLKKYSNKGFNTQIHKAHRFMRFSRSLQ